MIRQIRSRSRPVVGILGAAVILLGAGARGGGPGDRPELPRLFHLPVGIAVDAGPPEGWNHRVIRSMPRLATGELDSLPASASATATLLKTVIAADVVGGGSSYRLARVGIGNAAEAGKREVVTTPDGPGEVVDRLGTVDRMVVRAAESKLCEGRLVARTPTFALLRTPAVLVVAGKHEDVDLHYAMLVDPATGDLTSLAWAVRAGSGSAPGRLVVLAPNASFNVDLDVRVSRALGPVPLSWSFAMGALPPGRQVVVPASVGRLIAAVGTENADPAALEGALKSLVEGESAQR